MYECTLLRPDVILTS